ncbi:MAG: flagellar biosynthetic protein FliO, partial [Planctomycetota bacterium]
MRFWVDRSRNNTIVHFTIAYGWCVCLTLASMLVVPRGVSAQESSSSPNTAALRYSDTLPSFDPYTRRSTTEGVANRDQRTSAGSHQSSMARNTSAVGNRDMSVRSAAMAAMPLRTGDGQADSASSSSSTGGGSNAAIFSVCTSLAIVMGLFAALVWISRKFGGGNASGALPNQAAEVLGTTMLAPRSRLQLVRVGGRVLVLAHGPAGVTRLDSIEDPDEAARLVAACKGESAEGFREALRSTETTAPGFIPDEPGDSDFHEGQRTQPHRGSQTRRGS